MNKKCRFYIFDLHSYAGKVTPEMARQFLADYSLGLAALHPLSESDAIDQLKKIAQNREAPRC